MIDNSKQESIHTGSTFDSFLEEEGIRNEVQGEAIKRVLAWQFGAGGAGTEEDKAWRGKGVEDELVIVGSAARSDKTAVSLETLTRAANVLGKRLVFEIRD